MAWSNWARTVNFNGAVSRPSTLEELQQCVKDAKRVVVVGTGHSFFYPAGPAVVDGHWHDDNLVVLDLQHGFNKVLSVDANLPSGGTCSVEAGCNLATLAVELEKQGLALESFPSLTHITIAGAILTATHGSGRRKRVMADMVVDMTVVNAQGEVVVLTDPRHFLHFGLLGVVVRMTLRCVPFYRLQQRVYDIPLNNFLAGAVEATKCAESTSFWISLKKGIATAWLRNSVHQVAKEAAADPQFMGGTLRTEPVPAAERDAPLQTLVTGAWYDVASFFHIDKDLPHRTTVQVEFFVPLRVLPEALRALIAVPDAAARMPHIEIRLACPDGHAMSPCNKRFLKEDDLFACIHFGLPNDMAQVPLTVDAIERALKPLDARPHWGKLFTLSGRSLEKHYGAGAHEDCADFWRRVLQEDPEAKFRNALIDQVAKKTPMPMLTQPGKAQAQLLAEQLPDDSMRGGGGRRDHHSAEEGPFPVRLGPSCGVILAAILGVIAISVVRRLHRDGSYALAGDAMTVPFLKTLLPSRICVFLRSASGATRPMIGTPG